MSITPIFTFKAGKCDLDTDEKPYKVKPIRTPGYIYLYADDDFVHFCWRPRSSPASEPETDLLMIPGDGTFHPYIDPKIDNPESNLTSPTNGRMFVLKFQSSSQRYLFWMQSKSQHPDGNPNWFSERDQRLGQIVDLLLSGDDVDVEAELRELRSQRYGRSDDDDETMEDADGNDHSRDNDRRGSGGAGPDATGGDVREEGEEAREGGADGGRATAGNNVDINAVVQNFLREFNKTGGSGGDSSGSGARSQSKPFTTLPDLLPSSTTIPIIESASASFVDNLLSYLPPTILLLAQEADDLTEVEPNSETVQAAIEALSLSQKKDILKRVLRSPQLHQSLGSLTSALREGGLPMVSEALKIKVKNGGLVSQGAVPLGGGEAVQAFLEGVKKTVEEEQESEPGSRMETD